MITIKIKTWQDYNEQFLKWCEQPRKRICNEYVSYYKSIAQTEVENKVSVICSTHNLDEDLKNELVYAAQCGVEKAKIRVQKLINDCQPRDLI